MKFVVRWELCELCEFGFVEEPGELPTIFDSLLSLVVEVFHVGVDVEDSFGGCLNVDAEFLNTGLNGGSFGEFPLNHLELSFDGREDVVGEQLIFRDVVKLQ